MTTEEEGEREEEGKSSPLHQMQAPPFLSWNPFESD